MTTIEEHKENITQEITQKLACICCSNPNEISINPKTIFKIAKEAVILAKTKTPVCWPESDRYDIVKNSLYRLMTGWPEDISGPNQVVYFIDNQLFEFIQCLKSNRLNNN
jgi:uncharacterized protein YPO0396